MTNDRSQAIEDAQASKNFDELLREAAKKPLTRDEIRAQRISFAMGMMSHKNNMTREEVAKLIDSEDG